MAAWLYLKVLIIRALAQINTLLDRFFVSPKVLRPAVTVSIPTKLSKQAGNITLYFFVPPKYKKPTTNAATKKEYPLIVNFHGGGFTIGHANDDARWATTLLNDVDAVFVSVGYRKAPEYPQPIPVEDCVDALRWLWAHADHYGLDRSRTVVTGFSAGGNLSLTAPLRHYTERKAEVAETAAEDGKLVGIVAFYPSVNQRISRLRKTASNPISRKKGSLGPALYKTFDDAYYGELPLERRTSVNLSPALVPEEVLRGGLPPKIAIFTCEYDMLLVEGENFREKLKALGKTVGGRVMEDMPHGFDKLVGKYPKERDIMYHEAVEQIRSMI